jgi:hypothetical protein
MVENLLVFDIFACHFLPIAQSLHINLRWLGMRVQSENEAVWNFYKDQTSSSRRQDSWGLKGLSYEIDLENVDQSL